MRKTAFLTGVCLVALLVSPGAASPKPLTAEQEMELKTFAAQLAEPGRSTKTKLEAAELLLTRSYPQAVKTLEGFLSDRTNRPARIAIAQAIVQVGGARKVFIAPLTAMLTGEDVAVRGAAARALATYKNHGVTAKLIQIATDAKRDQAVRLTVIGALQRVLDKVAVDALVRLLDDRDQAIRAAAAGALAKLTNIRAFGTSRTQWRSWWEENKDKPRSEWLADLADRLARSKAVVEANNERLRDRLVRAMEDLYAATAPARRDALLMGFLKDPLADVRMVGVRLIERKLGSSEKVPADIRGQAGAMLADADPRVRRSAALLVANFADPDAGKVLLERLKTEQAPEVRGALLTALGQLQDPAGLEAILESCRSKHVDVAAAAARALGRVAAKHAIAGEMRTRAVRALVDRYTQTADAENGAHLREALLTAMGVLGDEKFIPVLRGAFKDTAAVVRLAAVNGLQKFGKADMAQAIAPLVADSDRGVRQAAIVALGALDGDKHLQVILQRTDPAAEPDAAVRQQAWDVGMALLTKSDVAVLTRAAADLADRPGAADQRIKILQMLTAALRRKKAPELSAVLRRLGGRLADSGRPAEAGVCLAEAYTAFAAANNPQAPDVWNQWTDAMLAADDPAVVKAIADQDSNSAFSGAVERLQRRVAALIAEEKWAVAIRLSGAAGEGLKGKLSEAQQTRIGKLLADARTGQVVADGKRVAALAGQLTAADEAVRTAAETTLKNMGDRAVGPLLKKLKDALEAEKPDLDSEKAILGVLKQIAPRLTGYDPAGTVPDRIKHIDTWIKGT